MHVGVPKLQKAFCNLTMNCQSTKYGHLQRGGLVTHPFVSFVWLLARIEKEMGRELQRMYESLPANITMIPPSEMVLVNLPHTNLVHYMVTLENSIYFNSMFQYRGFELKYLRTHCRNFQNKYIVPSLMIA